MAEWFTVNEAARHIRVSRTEMYRLIRGGKRAQGIYATVSREDRDAAAAAVRKLVLG